ncbi:hypothetical protein NHX12_021454 [Muraenolepis orangiensis]|uniref:Uncharacterized protein n=1 Tax=Muraenolepis orangiensis TaxID=630683 RepID=A0A9Q0IUE6_9TELE|nr:hypothetical protein NHX12_021454 [Muraenolepis orangiensis]
MATAAFESVHFPRRPVRLGPVKSVATYASPFKLFSQNGQTFQEKERGNRDETARNGSGDQDQTGVLQSPITAPLVRIKRAMCTVAGLALCV